MMAMVLRGIHLWRNRVRPVPPAHPIPSLQAASSALEVPTRFVRPHLRVF